MKVFISSVIRSMEESREAAARAVRALGHQVIRAEDFGANSATPQRTCLAGVREGDLIIVLLGSQYGEVQEGSRLSATHEEYREAKDGKPVLVFVGATDQREPEQDAFIAEAREWQSGQYTSSFSSSDELRDAVVRALRDFELGQAIGRVDVEALAQAAAALIPEERDVSEGSLCLAIAGGPLQQVIRPAELEDPSLSEKLMQEALFGRHRVFDSAAGSRRRLEGNKLFIEQDRGSIVASEVGSVAVIQPIVADPRSSQVFAIIQEDLTERLRAGLAAAAFVLDTIDPLHRLTDVVPCVGLVNAGYMGWTTQAERAANPNSWPTGSGNQRSIVYLSPQNRKRAALQHDVERIVDDLAVLLRRERTRY
jgi:hypothetical protein